MAETKSAEDDAVPVVVEFVVVRPVEVIWFPAIVPVAVSVPTVVEPAVRDGATTNPIKLPVMVEAESP